MNYLKSVIRILPTGFDETSALMTTIQEHKRAFMLLDLGRVISAHAKFLSYTCGFGMMESNNNHFNCEQNIQHLPPTHRLRRTGVKVNSIGRVKKGLYIQPQFTVTKNPNVQLLKLFVRLGVDLRYNSIDDIIAATKAITEEKQERKKNRKSFNQSSTDEHQQQDGVSAGNNSVHSSSSDDGDDGEDYNEYDESTLGLVLVDDASKTRKPNRYFRRLLQTRKNQNSDRFLEVAIDDEYEVTRISNNIRRLLKRSDVSSSYEETTRRFMLRLPTMEFKCSNYIDSSNGLWEKLILKVFAATMEQGGELYGVSVDLSPKLLSRGKESNKSSKDDAPPASVILKQICARLRIFRLLLLSVGQYHIRIDVSGLPTLSRAHCNLLTDMLSNMVSSKVSVEELMQVRVSTHDRSGEIIQEQLEQIRDLANDPSTCSLVFTADISDHLVARAGALCARIIGVKRKYSTSTSSSATTTETKVSDDKNKSNKKNIAINYFIDDGCYGSLGSSSCTKTNQRHVPIHLYGNNAIPKSQAHLSLSLSSQSRSSSTAENHHSMNKSKQQVSIRTDT